MNNNVLAEVAALPGKSPGELKKLWQDIISPDLPHYNKSHFVKRLAYRLQELAYDMDSTRIDKRLSALTERQVDKATKESRRLEVHRPVRGTRLVREWNGQEHCVTVLAEGFEYKKVKFNSLSAIAKKITGTKWNGLVFFGIKRMEDYRK